MLANVELVVIDTPCIAISFFTKAVGRRCGDQHLRFVAEAQAKHGVVEDVLRVSHFGQFVDETELTLGPAQLVWLLAREQLARCAVRPLHPALVPDYLRDRAGADGEVDG